MVQVTKYVCAKIRITINMNIGINALNFFFLQILIQYISGNFDVKEMDRP